jgi:hypothetical protein
MSEEITKYLMEECGFRKYYKPREKDILDHNHFSCVIRIHEIHYLYWSESLKYFTLGVMHERAKGKAGGGFESWAYMMIPKPIHTIEEVAKLIEGIVDFKYMKVICQ